LNGLNRANAFKEVRGMRKRIAAVVATCVVAIAMSVGPVSGAFAKITPASCENPGGNLPAGQQPLCKGGGHTQNPATNPAGNAPPGQQR
jgi:hypothetical protein